MAQIDNNLKKQLAKPQTWFCKYFPKRIRNVGEKEISDRWCTISKTEEALKR